MNACAGPAILVGWAVHLGASPVEVGLVGSLAQLSNLVQLPAAWACALFGRRRVALAAVALSRQALLPLALLPFAGLGPAGARAVLFGVAGVSAALGTAGNNAWTAWMGDLVPARLRGRYFGRRTAACVLVGTLGGLATARLLDAAGGRALTGPALALLALGASALGAVTTVLMARQHEPPGPRVPPPSAAAALRPLRDPRARGLLAYQVAWNASVGLASGYFAFHVLRDLGAGFTVLALHAAGVATARTLAAPLWGAAIDRSGARAVLAACSFGAAPLPLLWLHAAPGTLWPIALDAVLGGVAWSGHSLASFAAPLDVAPRRERPFYLAAFSMAGGLSYAAAVAAAGALAGAAAGGPPHGLRIVFAASAAGRLASAVLALRLFRADASHRGRRASELGTQASGLGPRAKTTARARFS